MSHRTIFARALRLLVVPLFFASALKVSAQDVKPGFVDQRRVGDEFSSTEKKIADAYCHLGVEYLREPSNSDIAVEQLAKAVGLDETNAEYHYRLAEAYRTNFEYTSILQKPFIASKVKAQLELAVQYDPSSVKYREALIQYYIFAPGIFGGSFVKAHEQANVIARKDAYLGMLAHAGIYLEEGEEQRSLDLFRKAMRTQPNSWEAYHRLGVHYLSIQEPDEAIPLFRKYIDVAPDQANAYQCLGEAYQQKRRYAEAIAAFQLALERDPSLSALVFRIAQLYEFKGVKSSALEHYQRYLSMVPRGRAADDAREKIRLLAR